jgi:S1-C subfamily serine protease
VLEHGQPKRGYLGIAGQPVRLPSHQRGPDAPEQALLVVGVSAGSPAEAAGLLVGDVVVAFDGHPIQSTDALLEALTGDRIGQTVVLTVLRGGHSQDVTVTVGERKNS